MHHQRRSPRTAAWLAAALLSLCATAAHAGKNVDPLRLQYERERAACLQGQTGQPRDVCLKEAGAAYAQARQGRLATPGDRPEQWAANALRRCQAQPPEDRDLCERRVREGEVAGSVSAGGRMTTLTVRSTDISGS